MGDLVECCYFTFLLPSDIGLLQNSYIIPSSKHHTKRYQLRQAIPRRFPVQCVTRLAPSLRRTTSLSRPSSQSGVDLVRNSG
ncbi:hypothetical protein BsWGS_22376 [Bradybaena similaris]